MVNVVNAVAKQEVTLSGIKIFMVIGSNHGRIEMNKKNIDINKIHLASSWSMDAMLQQGGVVSYANGVNTANNHKMIKWRFDPRQVNRKGAYRYNAVMVRYSNNYYDWSIDDDSIIYNDKYYYSDSDDSESDKGYDAYNENAYDNLNKYVKHKKHSLNAAPTTSRLNNSYYDMIMMMDFFIIFIIVVCCIGIICCIFVGITGLITYYLKNKMNKYKSVNINDNSNNENNL